MWKGSRLSGKGTRWERVAATRRSLTFTVSQRNQEHFFFFGKISKILLSDKERAKKIFLNICVPSPALSVHTVKVESPGGLPAQAPWREKARGWVRDSKCRRTCLAEGGDTGRKKRDGQESGGQLTAGTEQAELHSYPGRPGA